MYSILVVIAVALVLYLGMSADDYKRKYEALRDKPSPELKVGIKQNENGTVTGLRYSVPSDMTIIFDPPVRVYPEGAYLEGGYYGVEKSSFGGKQEAELN